MNENNQAIFRRVLENLHADKSVALITVVESTGSTPSVPGAKMVVYENGSIEGTIGGGALEKKAIEDGLNAIKNHQCRFIERKLTNQDAEDLGMVCGGQVKLFIEPIIKAPNLLLVGGGHIAQEITKIAHPLNFHITVLDDRKDFANQENFPRADETICDEIVNALKDYPITSNTYIVIVTRGHAKDQEALQQVVDSSAAYIGMIGSQKKIETVFQNMRNEGHNEKQLEKVYAPIGLDLGGNTPAEIAVSIIAEIIQVKNRGGIE